MLPKNRRISRKKFPFIIKNGRRFNSPHLLVYVAKTNQDDYSQFSFSISKKIFSNAVDRNKYRRMGYVVISENMDRIGKGYLCFFSFKKVQYPLEFSKLKTEVVSLLSEAGVLI